MSNQTGWQGCQKCAAPFYGGFSDQGDCASGGKHVRGQNLAYTMQFDPNGLEYTDAEGAAGIQVGWKWCRKCEGLFFGGGPNSAQAQGRCSAGGTHDATGSNAYVMQTGPPPAGMQGGWLWCQKCQGLFLAVQPGNPFEGSCPAGGAHDGSQSIGYDVLFEKLFNL